MRVEILGLAVALLSFTANGAGTAADPGLDDLLLRSAAYVGNLKTVLAVVVAEERYEQHYLRQSRDIQSEMLFMWMADERFWLTVRNVLKVERDVVPDSKQRLDRILQGSLADAIARLRLVQDEGSRFNIGPVQRTTNTPALVLQFLLPENQPRFAFTLKGREQMEGQTAWKIAFDERTRPTVIAFNGNPAPSNGHVWIRERDGAVLRTDLQLRVTQLQVKVRVDFRLDARFGVWVPATMDERYELDRRAPITCTAKYGNYRRFETSGRLVPPSVP